MFAGPSPTHLPSNSTEDAPAEDEPLAVRASIIIEAPTKPAHLTDARRALHMAFSFMPAGPPSRVQKDGYGKHWWTLRFTRSRAYARIF